MKYAAILMTVFLLFACKKDQTGSVNGTVIQTGGCFPDTWLLWIENPPGFPSICTDDPGAQLATGYNCRNSVFLRLPANLAQAGKKISFTGWNDHNFSCLSSSYAPHHLEVTGLSER